jgi:thioesterase domain-containing protein
VERICGDKLSMEEFYRNSSVKGLAAGLAHRDESGHVWDSPVLLADSGNGIPLYLVHTTPGDVFGYVNLAGQLAGRKVYAFQAYGLNPENEPHRTIPEMAAWYVKVLRECRPHGPYYLAGWCFGGTVAYEMACQLSEAGEEVGFLGLIETWGRPPLSLGHLFRQGWSLLWAGPRVWAEYGKEKIGGNHPGETPADGLDFIAARFGGSRGRREIEHLRKLYAVNMRAIRNYTMRHYRGTVELFCVSLADLSGVIPDPRRRWTGLADRIVIDEFHGGSHADILKPPLVDNVAEAVNTALAAADRRNS